MKVNKIICDGCDQDIDIEKDNVLAAFEHIEAKQKVLFGHSTDAMTQEKELVKSSYDLCRSCASLVLKTIEKIKKDTQNKSENKSKN